MHYRFQNIQVKIFQQKSKDLQQIYKYLKSIITTLSDLQVLSGSRMETCNFWDFIDFIQNQSRLKAQLNWKS